MIIDLLKNLFGKNVQESKNQNINYIHNEFKDIVKQNPAVQKLTGPDATQKAIEIHLNALVNLKVMQMTILTLETEAFSEYNDKSKKDQKDLGERIQKIYKLAHSRIDYK